MISNSTNDIFDSELLLRPEEHFYKKGYEEGKSQPTEDDHREGKELGIQTGFQRFIVVGALREIAEFLHEQILVARTANPTSDFIILNGRKKTYLRLQKQVSEVIQLLNSFIDSKSGLVVASNSDEDVENFRKTFKQARAKIRSLCSITGYGKMYSEVEKNCLLVGKKIPVSDISGTTDDSW
ncbi:hypothetical protein BRETT_003609 [Brettanomyces bruxellensis]|uniref:Essential protein Yae1 N-terminal domain-containing protein n=1 Tax=Dekkera bruxellensis TaxID=5007 RepID=A0A871R8Q9_DEKBR|nr:uncharacterized protein BRETT_003609 [Brettanomyces bruxellensis]QOU19462.1 hypothetical protein BRETT_003609 [Brettanomyces bruxellensis]